SRPHLNRMNQPQQRGRRIGHAVSCVICTTPRSGSWFLSELLGATGLAGRPEEYFRADWFQQFLARGALTYEHRVKRWPSENVAIPPVDLIRALSEFLSCVREIAASPNGVIGLKIHWHQFERVRPLLVS